MMLSSPRLPLWATVLADLRARLANGDFEERFPTDRELMAHYGVGRHTVREAVRRLDAVDRRPRLGGRLRRPQGALQHLGATLRAVGTVLVLTETGRHRSRSRPIAGALGLAPAKPMDVLVHVLLADGEPLLVSELWLPPGSRLGAADLESLLGLGTASEDLEVVEDSVLPDLATMDASVALHLPDGAAVFRADQLLAVAGQAAGWHHVLIRPERYRCVVRWDPTS